MTLFHYYDAIGQSHAALAEHEIAHTRIVSLVPSITELLIVLGLRQQLVARTGFCIHPASAVQDIPKIGGTKDVQLDKLRALKPTHCVVNVDENTREIVQALREFVPHVIVTHPCSPEDNLALFELLGGIFRREAEAQELSKRLRNAVLDSRKLNLQTRNVLYLIWREPWMTVARDTYISRMLAIVNLHTLPAVQGGDGLTSPGKARYPQLDWREPWLAQVDEVWLSSEPYLFSDVHIKEVLEKIHVHNPQASAKLIDGELCSWYGPRAIDGIHYLCELGPVNTKFTSANGVNRP